MNRNNEFMHIENYSYSPKIEVIHRVMNNTGEGRKEEFFTLVGRGNRDIHEVIHQFCALSTIKEQLSTGFSTREKGGCASI